MISSASSSRRALVSAAVIFHVTYALVAALHLTVKLNGRPDFQMLELPMMFKLKSVIAERAVPYWDTSIFNGVPLFATGSFTLFSPYNVLLLLPADIVFVALPSLLRALAATGMFYCLHNRLRLHIAVSMFGGALYSLQPVTDARVFSDWWVPLVAPALLPWLHATILSAHEHHSRRTAVVAGVLLSGVFYCGGLMMLPHIIAYLVVAALAVPVFGPAHWPRSPAFSVSWLVGALVTFAGLSAYQLIPTMEYLTQSFRFAPSQRSFGNFYLVKDLPLTLAYDLLPLRRVQSASPQFVAVNLLGWLILALFIVSLVLAWKRRGSVLRFHAALAVIFAVLVFLHEAGSFVALFRRLPIYRANLYYGLFIGDLLGVILISSACQALAAETSGAALRISAEAWRRLRPILIVIVMVFPLLLPVMYGPPCPLVQTLLPYFEGKHRTRAFLADFCRSPLPWSVAVAILFALLQAAWLLALRTGRSALGLRTQWLTVFVVVAYGTFLIPGTNFLRGLPFTATAVATAEARFFLDRPASTRYLIECSPGDQQNNRFHTLCGDALWLVGRRQLSGHLNLSPRRYMETVREIGSLHGEFSTNLAYVGPVDGRPYDWLTYDYVLTYSPLATDHDAYEFLGRGDRYYIYRPRQSTPRFKLYTSFVVEPDAGRRLARLAGSHPTDTSEVLLESEEVAADLARFLRSDRSTPASLSYTIVREHPDALEARVSADRNGILVLNENNYPGWQARVDGRVVPIFYANHFMRGLLLPVGEHTVTFLFRPASVRIGASISMAFVVLLVAAGILARLRTKRHDATC